MPVEYTFCFICSEKRLKKQFVAQIYWLVLNCVQENYHRCHYPQFSKKNGWGNSTLYISLRIKYFLIYDIINFKINLFLLAMHLKYFVGYCFQ